MCIGEANGKKYHKGVKVEEGER